MKVYGLIPLWVAVASMVLPACSAIDSLMQKMGLAEPPQAASEPVARGPKAAPLPEEKLEDILKKQQDISREVRDRFLRHRLGKAEQDDLHFVPYSGEEWAQVTRKEKR